MLMQLRLFLTQALIAELARTRSMTVSLGSRL